MTAAEMLVKGAAELGVQLSTEEEWKFFLLMAELLKWNKKINLTAITDQRQVVVKHFVDSLAAVQVLPDEGELLDLGSGGGFPVIPLKIVRPELSAVSVDAVEKKIMFQRQAARLLRLTGFTALHARGEALGLEHAGRYRTVVSRAFAEIPLFVDLAAPLLAEGGSIVAMKGKTGADEAKAAASFLQQRGLRVREVREYRLPVSGDARSLVIIERM